MTAPPPLTGLSPRQSPRRRRRSRPWLVRPRPAFTLTEMLIVIALVVLLVSLLLGALARVQSRARGSSSLATMQAFANACEAFRQEHGFYPGVVPEEVLANDPLISGTENAVLHLIGGYAREEDDPGAYANFNGIELSFNGPSGDYNVKVAIDRLGEGPVINGKPFAPYLTPGEREFAVTTGQPDPGALLGGLPEIVDAWGQPIMYLRRLRSIGTLTPVGGGGSSTSQFDGAPLTPYLQSQSLGRLGRNQVYDGDNLAGSILTDMGSDVANANLARVLGHPAIAGQARGAFMLLSAGPDGIYLSARDGPGSTVVAEEIVNVAELIDDGDLPPDIMETYDDILVFGGS